MQKKLAQAIAELQSQLATVATPAAHKLRAKLDGCDQIIAEEWVDPTPPTPAPEATPKAK